MRLGKTLCLWMAGLMAITAGVPAFFSPNRAEIRSGPSKSSPTGSSSSTRTSMGKR